MVLVNYYCVAPPQQRETSSASWSNELAGLAGIIFHV